MIAQISILCKNSFMNIIEIVSQFWQPAVFSFVFSVVAVLVALKFFPRLGLMDRPHLYGHKRSPIPYYGGLILFFVFMIATLVFVPLSSQLIGLLIGAAMIAILGFLDDLFNISPFVRIIVQFLAALVLVFVKIGVLYINLPFIGMVEFNSLLSAAFTVFWVLTILNTMNFVDGVSGLNSGVTFVAAMTIFFLSVNPLLHADLASQVPVATLSLILGMTALGFLIFDFPKPKILMGDTGSTFFGFMIAGLAIFSGGKVATAFLVLGIPILDMLWVVLRRIYRKQRFWKGDMKHLHHRLLDLGWSAQKVVLIYLAVTAVLGTSAVFLVSSQQKFFMLIGLGVFMSLLAAALVFVPRRAK